MLKFGIIGFGYWGPNLVRVFSQAPGSKVVKVADAVERNRARAANLYPNLTVHADARELIDDPAIDAIAIATPVSTHFELAAAALKAGKHVLVEKPLCATAAESTQLLDIADKAKRQIAVDHTFVYTGSVRRIKEMTDRGELGRILYYDSTRINLGLFQRDVNVLWDLVVHDVAILDNVMPERPSAVSAMTLDPLGSAQHSIAYFTLFYPSGAVAHVHASWLAPVKLRRVIFGGDKSMVVYDDLDPSEKIRIYDKGIEFVRDPAKEMAMKVEYRIGDMRAPAIDTKEALVVMADHINDSFMNNRPAMTSGEVGHRVTRMLEMADQSARAQGRVLNL